MELSNPSITNQNGAPVRSNIITLSVLVSNERFKSASSNPWKVYPLEIDLSTTTLSLGAFLEQLFEIWSSVNPKQQQQQFYDDDDWGDISIIMNDRIVLEYQKNNNTDGVRDEAALDQPLQKVFKFQTTTSSQQEEIFVVGSRRSMIRRRPDFSYVLKFHPNGYEHGITLPSCCVPNLVLKTMVQDAFQQNDDDVVPPSRDKIRLIWAGHSLQDYRRPQDICMALGTIVHVVIDK